jgi:hypothetical protein
MSGCATLVLASLLTGCAARHARAPAAAAPLRAASSSYVDLAPGWRLKVVTPILKSGGYRVVFTGETVDGNNITLSAGDDFLGYEVAYYAVKARSVEFLSAETTKDGHTASRLRPMVRLFELPRGVRHVRLIYLVRASQADHDMAMAAAKDMDALEALTRRVQANPVDGCYPGPGAFCAWIPAGIAVVPQLPKAANGGIEWAPAR